MSEKLTVYIHDEKTGGSIQKFCVAAGLGILTNEQVRQRKKMPEEYDFFLDQVDILIMEITKPTSDINFILAQAILAEKPTLCLYGKNQAPRQLIQFIRNRPSPRPVKTFSYTESSLEQSVLNFIKRHDENNKKYDAIPSVKFTIRFTPRNERFLSWYAEQNGISKADYIRELVEEAAKKNKEYVDPNNPEDEEDDDE